MKTIQRGVYFLANDRIIELTLAFLNSFRLHNPDLPLCLIPFRNDIQKLKILQDTYRFTIFEDADLLSFCDQLSLHFHPDIRGHYRKLVMWQGPFDEFIYIDVDMVVLKNLDFAFSLLQQADFIVSVSDLPTIRKWVWKESIYTTGLLTQEQVDYAANTGFIISSRNTFSMEAVKEASRLAPQLAPHMELSCMEQPLLNYLIVTSGKACTSLFTLLDTPLFPENYAEFWAGNKRRELHEKRQTIVKGKMREVFLVHWAGEWQLRKWEIRLYLLLYLLKIKKNIWSISMCMPFRRMWNHYRYLHL